MVSRKRQRRVERTGLLYAVTVPSVAQSFLRGQLRYMADQGWDVTLACSPGRGVDEVRDREGVPVHEIHTAREISLWQDLRSFSRWLRLIRRLRPAVLNASTPKAALLSLVAGRILGVPTRVYLVRGLRLESERGARRRLLESMERLSSWCATHVVAVSPSLRDELMRLDLCAGKEPLVISHGSSNGVDAARIWQEVRAHSRASERAALGVGDHQTLVAYIGRVRRDKGIAELSTALGSPRLHSAVLVTQGDVEDTSSLGLDALGPRHIHLGWRGSVSQLLAAADLLALPTHREGFPNVVLEAAAAGLPAVTTTATGAVDSVIDGVTGLVVPPHDPQALEAALVRLASDPGARARMGARARQRALDDFRPEQVWSELDRLYRSTSNAVPHPRHSTVPGER